jgi:predicted MFS family arabinose efflux permease
MKTEPNIVGYGMVNLFSSAAFYTLLSRGIELSETTKTANIYVTLVPLLYGLVWAISGYYFGRRMKQRGSRTNLGLQMHIIGCVVMLIAFAVVSLFKENLRDVVAIIATFGTQAFSITLHWLATHRQPKGISKEAAFK